MIISQQQVRVDVVERFFLNQNFTLIYIEVYFGSACFHITAV